MTRPSGRVGVLVVACLAVLLWSAIIVGFDRALQVTVSDDPGDGGANLAAESMGLLLWGVWATGTLFILAPAGVFARGETRVR